MSLNLGKILFNPQYLLINNKFLGEKLIYYYKISLEV